MSVKEIGWKGVKLAGWLVTLSDKVVILGKFVCMLFMEAVERADNWERMSQK